MVVLYEKNSLGNQPISDGENETRSRQKAVRSVAFIKKALLPQAAITLSLKKSQPTGVPLLLVRSVLLYSPRPRAQSNSVHMDARAEQPLGLGGRQHDGAAPYVIQRDQAVGADRLFSWLLLLLLLCKPLGHAAPRMVYGAARVPPWRRAPPLAHLYVVAVRAAGLESWPRLLLTARLGSGSKLVVVYQSVLAHSYSYDASHCQPLPVDLDIFSFVCPWSRFLLIFSNCPSRNRL